VTLNSDGTFTYIPTPGYVGQDSFVYEVCESIFPKTGLVVWADGSDVNGDGTSPANGSLLNTWTDKSGAGNDLILGTGDGAEYQTNQLNGESTMRFNGDWYSTGNLNLSTNHTLFYVYDNEVNSRSWIQSRPYDMDCYPKTQFRVNSFNAGGNPM